MTDTETITVADVSAGPGGDADADPGTPVSLPVVELLTGRGFITGKSGSGKSNTASVLVENLLDNNFPVLVVDTDGEYYGLKEAYELLHVGADDECDIQVGPEHAEKLASLALEGNVPIILDVSGYLDDDEAKDLLLSVARHLFAKEKKLKKPFLLLVEEVHEYVPEGGGLDETGKMLIKIGKRGRKHGLGIVGISQRPADVKKDYITQCDWLVWHRLTWDNDTKVVRRIIDGEHASAVEDLADGEAFLMTDWSESVRRVQFHRKRTFDAGATPGLDDFERPELKSVSDDLVSELQDIGDEQARRESELADLRQELERKERRIEELERELSEARDLSRMADRFAEALLQRDDIGVATDAADGDPDASDVTDATSKGTDSTDAGDGSGDDDADADGPERGDTEDGDAGGASFPVSFGEAGTASDDGAEREGRERESADTDAGADGRDERRPADAESGTDGDGRVGDETEDDGTGDGDGSVEDEPAEGEPAEDEPAEDEPVEDKPVEDEPAEDEPVEDEPAEDEPVEGGQETSTSRPAPGTREAVVHRLRSRIEDLPPVSRRMLEHYREVGVAEPVDAHVAAGGTPDEPIAYGRNRPLRRAELVEHAGGGRYRYALPDRVAERVGDRLDGDERAAVLRAVEREFVDPEDLQSETESTESDVPDGERDDVEMVEADAGVDPDDGFVAEDAVIVDDGGDAGDGRAGDDETGHGGTGDATDDAGARAGDGQDGETPSRSSDGADGGTERDPADGDAGGVELL